MRQLFVVRPAPAPGRDRETSDDDISAPRVEAGTASRSVVIPAESRECARLRLRGIRPADGARRAHALTREENAREIRERPAGTDYVRATPVAKGQCPANVVADVLRVPRNAAAPPLSPRNISVSCSAPYGSDMRRSDESC